MTNFCVAKFKSNFEEKTELCKTENSKRGVVEAQPNNNNIRVEIFNLIGFLAKLRSSYFYREKTGCSLKP